MSPVFERLDRLRVVSGRSWDQLAELLNVDRSMFFHVKAGRRNLSSKALFRLAEAERASGIQAEPERRLDRIAEARSVAYGRAATEQKNAKLSVLLDRIATIQRELERLDHEVRDLQKGGDL